MALKISNASMDIRVRLPCNCVFCSTIVDIYKKAEVNVSQNSLKCTIRVESMLWSKAQNTKKEINSICMYPENFLVLFWGLSHIVVQAGLKLVTSLLPQLDELYYRHGYDTQPRENFSSYLFKTFLSYHYLFSLSLKHFCPQVLSLAHT